MVSTRNKERLLNLFFGRSEYNKNDFQVKVVLSLVALATVVLVFSLFIYFLDKSLVALSQWGIGFYLGTAWDPSHENFGALIFFVGSFITSLISIFLAAPICLLCGIFLSLVSGTWKAKILRTFFEVLASLPSIVVGFWALLVLVPWFSEYVDAFLELNLGAGSLFSDFMSALTMTIFYPLVGVFHFMGFSVSLDKIQFHVANLFSNSQGGVGIFTTSIVLAIILIPSFSLYCRQLFLKTYRLQKEDVLALGATRWEVVKWSMLNTSRKSLLSALTVGFLRVFGETMVVILLIGNVNQWPQSIFSKTQTMTGIIVRDFHLAEGMHFSALMAVALGLIFASLALQWASTFWLSKNEGELNA